jgi:drug/metabolite transporter (DMT)-like permease
MPDLSPLLLGSAIFAVVGGTLMTYFLSNWALAHTHSTQVALFVYIQPVVAALFAWAWMGQPITPRMVASSGLVFVGVFLVLRHREVRR